MAKSAIGRTEGSHFSHWHCLVPVQLPLQNEVNPQLSPISFIVRYSQHDMISEHNMICRHNYIIICVFSGRYSAEAAAVCRGGGKEGSHFSSRQLPSTPSHINSNHNILPFCKTPFETIKLKFGILHLYFLHPGSLLGPYFVKTLSLFHRTEVSKRIGSSAYLQVPIYIWLLNPCLQPVLWQKKNIIWEGMSLFWERMGRTPSFHQKGGVEGEKPVQGVL